MKKQHISISLQINVLDDEAAEIRVASCCYHELRELLDEAEIGHMPVIQGGSEDYSHFVPALLVFGVAVANLPTFWLSLSKVVIAFIGRHQGKWAILETKDGRKQVLNGYSAQDIVTILQAGGNSTDVMGLKEYAQRSSDNGFKPIEFDSGLPGNPEVSKMAPELRRDAGI